MFIWFLLHVVFFQNQNLWHSYFQSVSILQLQSLTLRPPPPGTLTIPPNLPLKHTTSSQPPPLSFPRLPTFHLRPSQPANAPGKDGASKTGSPASQTKAPVRHLTVPPPCKWTHTYLTLQKIFKMQMIQSNLETNYHLEVWSRSDFELFFKRSLFCWPKLHLFNQKYSNIVKDFTF